MLSYEQIGAAAMMSRACAGLVAGRIVVSLPGSEAAVRLAMERLLIPELGHLVQQATKSSSIESNSVDDSEVLSSESAACGRSHRRSRSKKRGAGSTRPCARSRAPSASRSTTPPGAWPPPTSRRRSTCRRSRDRRWTATRSSRPTPAARRAIGAGAAAAARSHLHRPDRLGTRRSPGARAPKSPPARRCRPAPTRS